MWISLEVVGCARPFTLAQDARETAEQASVTGGNPPRIEAAPAIAPETMAAFLEAELALSAGQTDRALARLMPLAEKKNCPPEVFETLAEVHLAANAPDKALGVLQAGIKRFPNDIEMQLLRGRALRAQGKYADAIAAIEEGLKSEPHRQEALETLSELHLQQLRQVTNEDELDKQMGSLISIYERMLAGRQGGDRLPPLLILSSLNLRRNQPAAAEPFAREAVELDGREPRAWMALAGVREAQNQTTEALQAYKQALLLEPGNSEVREKIDALLGGNKNSEARIKFYLELAREYPAIKDLQDAAVRLLLQANRWAAAEERLKLMTQNWPDDSKARLALVRVWLAQGKLDAGITAARAMADRKEEFAPLVALSLAEALAQKNEPDRATALLMEFYGKNKDDESLAVGAATMLGNQDKEPQGLELLKEYRQRHPESIKALTLQANLLGDAKNFTDAYALLESLSPTLKKQNEDALKEMRVQLLQGEKKWSEALTLMGELLQKHPEDAQYHSSAGYACQQLGRNAEAEAHYREALRLLPDDPEMFNTLGYFLAETKQKLDEALTLILKAHEMEPTAAHIIDSLGWVYYQKGDFNNAVQQLQQATTLMRLSPEAAEVFEHLGDAYEKLGRMDDARQAWRKALDLNKDQATAREKLNRK
jgi:Flp pilus assembly protein TadD